MSTNNLSKVELNEIESDAKKWRALINSKRIRILGSGGLGKDNQHFGMEIWDNYNDTIDNSNGINTLNIFVETIIKRGLSGK
jgi:hypothetical protein